MILMFVMLIKVYCFLTSQFSGHVMAALAYFPATFSTFVARTLPVLSARTTSSAMQRLSLTRPRTHHH